jgi:hypothetical protein
MSEAKREKKLDDLLHKPFDPHCSMNPNQKMPQRPASAAIKSPPSSANKLSGTERAQQSLLSAGMLCALAEIFGFDPFFKIGVDAGKTSSVLLAAAAASSKSATSTKSTSSLSYHSNKPMTVVNGNVVPKSTSKSSAADVAAAESNAPGFLRKAFGSVVDTVSDFMAKVAGKGEPMQTTRGNSIKRSYNTMSKSASDTPPVSGFLLPSANLAESSKLKLKVPPKLPPKPAVPEPPAIIEIDDSDDEIPSHVINKSSVVVDHDWKPEAHSIVVSFRFSQLEFNGKPTDIHHIVALLHPATVELIVQRQGATEHLHLPKSCIERVQFFYDEQTCSCCLIISDQNPEAVVFCSVLRVASASINLIKLTSLFDVTNSAAVFDSWISGIVSPAQLFRMKYDIMFQTSTTPDVVPSSPRRPRRRSTSLDDPHVLFSYPPSERGAIAITAGDLARVQQQEYFNDNLIDFYLKYLLRAKFPQLLSKVFIFSSFFYRRLTAKVGTASKCITSAQYDAVARWTRDVDIFAHDYIVIPINQQYAGDRIFLLFFRLIFDLYACSMHWTMIIISNPSDVWRDDISPLSSRLTRSGSGSSPIAVDSHVPAILHFDSLMDRDNGSVSTDMQKIFTSIKQYDSLISSQCLLLQM